MIEIKTSKNHLEKVKFLKEFQLFLKLEKPSNHSKWVWKNSFIKSLLGIHRQKWEQLSLMDAYTTPPLSASMS
jgi:hypothetical protein